MHNSIWLKLYEEATSLVKTEPLLASYVYACILNHNSMGSALSFLLANKLSDEVMPAIAVRELFDAAYTNAPDMIVNAVHDMQAVFADSPVPQRLSVNPGSSAGALPVEKQQKGISVVHAKSQL